MSSTALAVSSAGGAASACCPLNRPTFSISSAFNASTTTPFMMSKKNLLLPLSSSSALSTFYSARTSVNYIKMRLISHLPLGRNCCSTITIEGRRRRRRRRKGLISCEVALGSNNSASSSATVTKEQDGEEKKIGAKVRVKVPLKVYHVPRVPEVDLTGKEGHLKQYVALWKGKRISANLPFRVEFVVDIEGRGPVKFLTHLKEDEFEYLE